VTSSRQPAPGYRRLPASRDAGALPGSRPVPFTAVALELLRAWPALEVSQAGRGAAVRARHGGPVIARLHHPDTAGLLLTGPAIERLGSALADGGRVRAEPGGDWVRMPVETAGDVRLLLLLMSVAIRADRH